MRFRIGALIELVFVVAMGLAYNNYLNRDIPAQWLNPVLMGSIVVGQVAQGMVFAFGLCVLAGWGIRRSKIELGVGRIGCIAYSAGLSVSLGLRVVEWLGGSSRDSLRSIPGLVYL